MKRIITIISILVLIAAVFFGISWLLSRRSAVKNGTPVPTFREFITGTTGSGSTPTGPGGELSSDFTNPGTTTSGTGTGDALAPSTRTSIFTNTSLSPESTTPTQGEVGGAVGTGTPTSGDTNGGTQGGNGSTTPTPSTGGSEDTGPLCSEQDLNITFTPEELTKLKALQNRFYAVADILYTDANVATEVANYSSFKIKTDQIVGYTNLCESLEPSVAQANADFATRTPTPFWYGGPNLPFTGYLNQSTGPAVPILFNGTLDGAFIPGPLGVKYTKVRLERALQLNLW